ncbi:ArsR/SmtB family transcription factor [Brevibacillus daliensis]|uniref:ArsR/SmtB family transcription factor n=1 Tax=Brevibacillus daliensis TaxID=2892995 RepID=UPI001E283E9C|nr:metalloregulator ArsR/SmtB family transcription factor [Brevibacillus daliensis]
MSIGEHTQKDICEIECVEAEKVKDLRPRIEEANGVAPLFKALADDTRSKIIYALSLTEELCVCDVAAVIGISVATASHHLRLLRNLGLAKYRKVGKMVYYSLDDDHVRMLIHAGVEHANESKS